VSECGDARRKWIAIEDGSYFRAASRSRLGSALGCPVADGTF
jgi:hypothetical protein